MRERVARELELVRHQYGELEVDPNLDSFIIRQVALSAGWNKPNSSVLVLIPAGYPTTAPDNFYADPDLRLANGAVPSNASPNQTAVGQTWLLFSFHVQAGDWQPDPEVENGHNLLTYVRGISRRLGEAS
jgi:hypothetical protein